jgi:iron complex transport system ATP-binding protein
MTLAAEALDFGYPARVIGRALDVSMERGEVVCVLGPNGAGKTTLFRTLLGLLPPLAGRVHIDHRDIASLPRAEIARAVAYVPQASASHFDFTLAEAVEMGRCAHLGTFERPGPRDRQAALAALERMGIAALAARPIGSVSGGERQLALVARALATEARMLVMDEPTASLDFGNQARVLDEVARLAQSGIGVLLCTHDPGHAFRIADRALLLTPGGSTRQGPVDEVLNANSLSELYGIEVQVTEVETPSGRRRVCVPAARP